mgnify:CR=1 FL=1
MVMLCMTSATVEENPRGEYLIAHILPNSNVKLLYCNYQATVTHLEHHEADQCVSFIYPDDPW